MKTQQLQELFKDFKLIGVHIVEGKGYALETRDEFDEKPLMNAIFNRLNEVRQVQTIPNEAGGYYYSCITNVSNVRENLK